MLKARWTQVLVCLGVCLHFHKTAGELKEIHQRSNVWKLTVARGGKAPETNNPMQFICKRDTDYMMVP